MQERKRSYLFTSESVTEGHPDKICDQISDAILDAILAKEIELASSGYVAPDGNAADPTLVRCACETMATTGMIVVTGEIRTQAYVDVPGIVRDVLRDIGYDRARLKADAPTTSTTALAPAIRAWCSVTPATRRRPSCRFPSTSPIAFPSASRASGRTARCPICAPTARLR